MRTAEEIIKYAFDNTPDNIMVSEVYVFAINEARIEAIKECADTATAWIASNGAWVPSEAEAYVDKQSILKLIDQVK